MEERTVLPRDTASLISADSGSQERTGRCKAILERGLFPDYERLRVPQHMRGIPYIERWLPQSHPPLFITAPIGVALV